ncbi:O-antigen ligase family protein [Caulobacter sp. LjRoot300]|uniref:O-antigen ligase family protein n=1 Tax=Caulobacter sp. LjRoot300 TaxID=3342321 RepID=UPI003ECC379E
MASRQARRRHRRLLAPRAPASAGTRWRRLALAAAPAGLYLTHLAAGANQTAMAQGFSLALALALCAALTRPRVRNELAELGFVWPLLGLFATVLAVALLTLYLPASPASAPVWALAGAPGVLTINRSATWLEIVKLCGLASVFAVGCVHGARGERARTSIDWIVLLGGVYAALSIAFFLAGLQVKGRLSGGFLSANSGATVFGMLAVITTAFLLRQLRRTARLDQGDRLRKLATPAGSLLFIATCLVLTASRMGLAATGVSILVLLAWDLASQRKIRITIRPRDLALAAAALAVVGVASIPMWTRVDELDSDATIRGLIFSTHWNAFLASPVFGHGLGSFNDVNGQTLTTENYSVLWSIRAAHNVYIQWLEEAGVAGALPMFALVAAITLISALHVSKMRSGKTLARGLVASSAVVLLHGTTDYALQVPSIAAFWAFLLGLQFAFTQWRS